MELISEKEATVRLGRAVVTLRQWRQKRRSPPFYRINGMIQYDWPEVVIWMEAQRG